jgi:hypothetical protein
VEDLTTWRLKGLVAIKRNQKKRGNFLKGVFVATKKISVAIGLLGMNMITINGLGPFLVII